MLYYIKRIKDLGFFNTIKRMNFRANKTIYKMVNKPRLFGQKLPFYQDVKIEQKKCNTFDEFYFDIKTEWEESRFQDLYFYSDKTFEIKIDNWIKQNPFLCGLNWACPMEVAIRAINWIYGFYLFKDSKNISSKFWKEFINSLYQHAKYLQNNWETSDRPNNHYLSDLIGYFYLCCFFEDKNSFKKQKRKTFFKILQQFDHQIQDEGTSYEGSTNYHKLDTEIFLHFYKLCKFKKIKLPKNFEIKLKKMFLFLEHCSDYNNNLVQIGDNDSGKITSGITNTKNFQELLPLKKTSDFLHHYPNFGLSIIKTNIWHVTFRHPTYLKKQPSGHFHQDDLSITFSFNNIPILVDPGTYVYTPNTKWRNLFRSYKMHNTFYIKDENNLDNLDLFQLPKKPQLDTSVVFNKKNIIEIQNYLKHFKLNLKQYRNLKLNLDNNYLEINDWWNFKSNTNNINKVSEWNFIFHPKIKLKLEKKIWNIIYEDKKILKIETNLDLKSENGFYSSGYGELENTTKLTLCKKICVSKVFILFKPI